MNEIKDPKPPTFQDSLSGRAVIDGDNTIGDMHANDRELLKALAAWIQSSTKDDDIANTKYLIDQLNHRIYLLSQINS